MKQLVVLQEQRSLVRLSSRGSKELGAKAFLEWGAIDAWGLLESLWKSFQEKLGDSIEDRNLINILLVGGTLNWNGGQRGQAFLCWIPLLFLDRSTCLRIPFTLKAPKKDRNTRLFHKLANAHKSFLLIQRVISIVCGILKQLVEADNTGLEILFSENGIRAVLGEVSGDSTRPRWLNFDFLVKLLGCTLVRRD
ncbi:hypothetical protein AAG906_024703 [Vitis piasezkii]